MIARIPSRFYRLLSALSVSSRGQSAPLWSSDLAERVSGIGRSVAMQVLQPIEAGTSAGKGTKHSPGSLLLAARHQFGLVRVPASNPRVYAVASRHRNQSAAGLTDPGRGLRLPRLCTATYPLPSQCPVGKQVHQRIDAKSNCQNTRYRRKCSMCGELIGVFRQQVAEA